MNPTRRAALAQGGHRFSDQFMLLANRMMLRIGVTDPGAG
jgi:hypothetical protein